MCNCSRGVSTYLFGWPCKDDLYGYLCRIEMPRDDQAIAAVVAFAAADDDFAFDPQLQHEFSGPAPGVLHEHGAWDAVLFDGLAVQFAELPAGKIKWRHKNLGKKASVTG